MLKGAVRRPLTSLWWSAALLGGCLLLADPPEGAVCQDGDCPGNLACDDYSGECPDECYTDDDCVEGYACPVGADVCEIACKDEECPDHLTCDTYENECQDRCYGDDYCREGYRCCDTDDWSAELCDWGECIR